jgi:alpha-galactosidase
MSGALGYELDLEKVSAEDKEEIKRQIAQYHQDEELIHEGLYYRLTDISGDLYYTAWQIVSEDRSCSLVNLVVTNPQPNPAPLHIRLRGLDPDGLYRIEEDVHVRSGAALMNGGYTFPPMQGDYPAIQLHLFREGSVR